MSLKRILFRLRPEEAVALAFVLPTTWLTAAAYVYAREYAAQGPIKQVMDEQTLLYYKESTEGTVSVWQAQQVTSLRTLFFRFAGITLFALVLAVVSTVVRWLLLKKREVTHT